jgi:hypothetical protein
VIVAAPLALLLFAVVARAGAQEQLDLAKELRGLRETLEQTPDDAAQMSQIKWAGMRAGASVAEREAREGRRALRLTFAWPIPARVLIAAMGWERPYAVSGDTHQNGWSLRLFTADIDDRSGTRIATHTPHVGAWAVDATLDGRPAGELPKLASGGSPAYDLLHGYDAKVTSLLVEPWQEGWQVADHIEPAEGEAAPKHALNAQLIKDWIEARKGFGYPRYFDSGTTAPEMRVLAAWNIPTSGLNWTYFWVYCLAPTAGWTLLESGYFQPLEDQAHSAVLDVGSDEVRFLGKDGTIYHRVPVAGCQWKRP